MSKRRKTRPKQPNLYTGDLAKPLGYLALPADAFAELPVSENKISVMKAQRGRERIAEIDRRFKLLFEHHHIEFSDFLGLALALAFAHVPGLQLDQATRRRGRPRKPLNLQAIYAQSQPRQVGRPKKLSDVTSRELVHYVEQWKEGQQKLGVKKPSDRGFLLAMCKEAAKKSGKRESVVIKVEFRRWANRLSRARKLVSKS